MGRGTSPHSPRGQTQRLPAGRWLELPSFRLSQVAGARSSPGPRGARGRVARPTHVYMSMGGKGLSQSSVPWENLHAEPNLHLPLLANQKHARRCRFADGVESPPPSAAGRFGLGGVANATTPLSRRSIAALTCVSSSATAPSTRWTNRLTTARTASLTVLSHH